MSQQKEMHFLCVSFADTLFYFTEDLLCTKDYFANLKGCDKTNKLNYYFESCKNENQGGKIMKAKSTRFIIIISALILILCNFVACNSIDSPFSENIDLSEYIVVSFNGYNGAGRAQVDTSSILLKDIFDEEKVVDFVNQYNSFEGLDTEETIRNWILSEYHFYNLFDFEFVSEKVNLSNGDTVTVKVIVKDGFVDDEISLDDIRSGLGVDFEEEFTFTVSGLKDGIAIDILSDIEQYITYTGANGGGEAEIEIPEGYSKEVTGFYLTQTVSNSSLDVVYNNEKLGWISFSIDSEKMGKLSAGDQLTISISTYGDSELEKYNLYFAPIEKQITVPDLGSYITSADELSSQDFEQLKQAIIDGYKTGFLDSNEYMVLDDVYAGTLKPQYTNDFKSTLVVYLVAKEEVEFIWESLISYVAYPIYNIAKAPDGTLLYDFSASGGEDFDTLEELDTYMSEIEEYEFTKIK